MSEFEKFIEENFKELKIRIEIGNFFAKTMKDSMRATWLERQSEIDQLKYERDAFQEFHRDCKAEIDQLKAQLEVKHSSPSQKTHFEDMIRQSPDFATLLNIHGERLFIKRELSYDVLAMRSAYWAWLWVHVLYKDISEMCDERLSEMMDIEAENEKLKVEKAELEKSEFKLAQIKSIIAKNPNLLESILIKKIENVVRGDS